MKELSIYDDMDGMLTCDKCGVRMSALSKCDGTDCKKKSTCLRYTLEPLPKWQPYLVMSVSIKDVDACRWFISNKAEETLDAPNLIS